MPDFCHGVVLWTGILHRYSSLEGLRKAKWERQFVRPTSDRILGLTHITVTTKEFYVIAPLAMHERTRSDSRATILHARVSFLGLHVLSDDPHAILLPLRKDHGSPELITEFFAGIGGCASAADLIPGCTVNQAFEIDQDVARLHHRIHPTVTMTMCDFNDRRTWTQVDLRNGTWTMTCPCQPFSHASKKRKGWLDDRSHCLVNSLILCAAMPPVLALIENVPDLLTVPPFYKPLLEMLTELGLQWRHAIYNANYFIPQSRKRAFILITPENGAPPVMPRLTGKTGATLSDFGLPAQLRPADETAVQIPQATLDIYNDPRYIPEGTRRVVKGSNFMPTVLHSYGNSIGWASSGSQVFGFFTPSSSGSSGSSGFRHFHPCELLTAQGFPTAAIHACLNHCRASPPDISSWWAACGNSVPPPLVAWILDHTLPHGRKRASTELRNDTAAADTTWWTRTYITVHP